MFDRSVIEISKDRIHNNIAFIRDLLPQETELCAVVKGNAYGHGLDVYPRFLEQEGVGCFAVSSPEEAYELKPCLSDRSRIIVLVAPRRHSLEWLISNEIEFYIGAYDDLEQIAAASSAAGKPARVHLELETGLYRTGVREEQLEAILNKLASTREIFALAGVCTHLAGAECRENETRVLNQLRRFEVLSEEIRDRLDSQAPRHAACSAAAIAYPQSRFEMVRVGVLQYGFWPTLEIKERFLASNSKPERVPRQALSWKTYIHSIRRVPEGSYVGYGKSYKAQRDMRTATLPIGYADGFSRSLSNKGYVLVKGKRAPVVGNVTMNMLTIDVTDIDGVRVEDEVVILGDQQGERIVVSSFSDLLNTLNYESLVRIADHIERRIVEH